MLKITNPATGKTIREVETDTAESVAQKFARARAAQAEWARISITERVATMQRLKTLIERDAEKIAMTLTQEVGKGIAQSRNEVKGLAGRFDFFMATVEETMSEEKVFSDGGMEEVIGLEPLGVVANISAWNYPLFVGFNVIVPALLTGNAVLYKPSEFATLTGLLMAELIWEAGVPKDIFIPVIGTGAVGVDLLKQPIHGVFFTGSYATGAKIAEAAAKKMIKFQLELGGKDPAYVAEDVNVANAAASTADGAFYNTGQSCCSVERIYVHTKIYDHFVEEFVKTVKSFVTGDPSDEKTYIGPLTRGAHVPFLENQVADAVAKGARLLTGGKRRAGAGNYFEPTVFTNVNHSMDLMREESFGPIIGIQKVAGDEEALKLMNDTPYGLTAAVYTASRERANRILGQVQAGSAYWNCCDRVSPRLPWSGRGHSGVGATLSKYGILAFLQPKAWHLRAPS
ncbi:MAG: aldehyde dehydrogenase family protein [Bacteriovoracia bacterium]